MKWAIELLEFEVSFEVKKALKSHILSHFMAEMTLVPLESDSTWVVFTDSSSNNLGSGTGVILENGSGMVVEFSLRFKFPTTNN